MRAVLVCLATSAPLACGPSPGDSSGGAGELDGGSAGGAADACVGACGSQGGGDSCAEGAELIYLVDEANQLWSFDPQRLPDDPFESVGTLTCPAGAALPEADPFGGQATPFSMSVDRDANAWVLYSSGELFQVSTDDASCQATSFEVGQQGFSLFGMGFVADQAGADEETLFISGGAGLPGAASGELGTIVMEDMSVSSVGTLPSAEYSPELTGTGDAELFAYFPGQQESFVARLDKSSAQDARSWDLPALGDQVRAWAFAHWGGRFYIFVTTTDALGLGSEANVLRLDPDSEDVEPVLTDTGRIVVGAGVSTCAPVVVD